jgi:pimeloyl-ACP methyl ester carboxylesterase
MIKLAGADDIGLTAATSGPEDGRTVVLLHGGGQTRHSWHGTSRFLVDSGACEALHTRDQGAQSRSPLGTDTEGRMRQCTLG